MATRKTILVTGATGKQGGAVARSLLSRGQIVRVLTRSPEKAADLSRLGAEVVRGDFDDKASLKEAIIGCDGAYLMGTFFEKGVKAEVEQGERVVMAAWKCGVPHLVYSSVCGANRDTGIPHFESKRRVEDCIKETGVPHTILRPVFFMDNFESPFLLPSITKGEVRLPLRPECRLQVIAVSDIGEFAAEALLRPKEFGGKEIDLAGDELTIADAVSRISCAVNRPVRYERIPDEKAGEALGHDLALMYRFLDEHEGLVNIDELKRRWGIPLTTFSTFLGRSALGGRANAA